jgi:hypothetical protein
MAPFDGNENAAKSALAEALMPRPWLLLPLLRPSLAQVRRPARASHYIDFEGLSSICDFADGTPISDQYAARLATFTGPGFGALNGGVPTHACTLSGGAFPPLNNELACRARTRDRPSCGCCC